MSTRVEVIHVQGIAPTRSLILSFACFVYELLKHEVQLFENRNINNTGLNSSTLFTNYQVQKFFWYQKLTCEIIRQVETVKTALPRS